MRRKTQLPKLKHAQGTMNKHNPIIRIRQVVSCLSERVVEHRVTPDVDIQSFSLVEQIFAGQPSTFPFARRFFGIYWRSYTQTQCASDRDTNDFYDFRLSAAFVRVALDQKRSASLLIPDAFS